MEDNLKIVELKKCSKKVNKALRWKICDMLFAVCDVALVCDGLKKYMDNKDIFYLIYSAVMTVCYAGFIYYSRMQTEIIDENFDKAIDFEELMDEVELSK